MLDIFKNTKGAVTVIVTLLLIPAVLISGTAVDLARINTAQSILRDANQLSANSVLTQYNALLYDLYGLFGLMADDPVLAGMVDEYINITIFGEDWYNRKIGTFQLFYGSKLHSKLDFFVDTEPKQNLKNPAILRRQIEEYMKFRAPVIIVKNILEALEGSQTIKEDAKAIEEKLEIDEDIADLYELYKRLYNAINEADKCVTGVGLSGSYGAVSSSLKNIKERFAELRDCYQNWKKAGEEPDEEPEGDTVPSAENEAKKIYSEKYQGIIERIMLLTNGGPKNYTTWRDGKWKGDPPVWESGYWNLGSTEITGLNTIINNAKEKADEFKKKFTEIADIAKEIAERKAELEKKIDNLEKRLKSGKVNENLKKALTEPDSDGKSQIQRYREMLKWDIPPLANEFKKNGDAYIETVKKQLDGVRYKNGTDISDENSIARSQLAALSSYKVTLGLGLFEDDSENRAEFFAGFTDLEYHMPEGFKKFKENSDKHLEFYEELKKIVNASRMDYISLDDVDEGTGSDAEEKQKNVISNLMDLAQKAYNGLTNNPQGAKYIKDFAGYTPKKINFLESVKMVGSAVKDDILNTFTDPLGQMEKMGDYTLLLTYCTSVFSNYTTAKPESIGKAANEIKYEKSITGVPISPKVNYFYQSEWEYLYKGSQNAEENLNSITFLILTVRIVCNYITVFSVSSVTTLVSTIRTAFSWAPPLGVVLGELARAAFVIAESVVDLADLRTGNKVPLIKSNTEWVCSPSGIGKLMKNLGAAAADDKKPLKLNTSARGLTYSNYMLCMFIGKAFLGLENAANEMTQRAAQLIEWNMINYKNEVNADENKMSNALELDDIFRLENAATGFSVSSQADLKMLFLSMPFAQKGINKIVPTKFFPVTAKDYRGY